ncbi:MAG: DNA-directed RNA polymerase subunit omega [Bdellovibrionaceae bacterium]|nr:DNA-directed RNA polymerase subunit omega [Pseudobdellovibrionaceae bacterium]|tara:strand:+ start:6907 stop:7134 length:228 start_codon:yes stop_codon:yes gene_type:complete
MARITVDDCLKRVDNMYELIHLATKRARQIHKGSTPLIKCKNRYIVTALREIAEGKVRGEYQKAVQEDDFSVMPH